MFGGSDRNELRKYFTLSQVGLEMVAPIGVGVLVDRYLDSSPWGVSVGAVLGLAVGLIHLVKLSGADDAKPPGGESESPP